ncbi:hypothetical protein K523DRAFT_377989 [Schizophyllum commune Tattone D]|nr:hypothetical protein K523DRAFT_377989 [Schizophyllum commune Tattone D]
MAFLTFQVAIALSSSFAALLSNTALYLMIHAALYAALRLWPLPSGHVRRSISENNASSVTAFGGTHSRRTSHCCSQIHTITQKAVTRQGPLPSRYLVSAKLDIASQCK